MSNMKKTVSVIFIAATMALSLPAMAKEGRQRGEQYAGPKWTEQQKQDYLKYRTDKQEARLAYMAKQLNITPAQQSAFNDFSKAVTNMANQRVNRSRSAKDAGLSVRMKHRAEHMTVQAKALEELSLATEKLETQLTEEQKAQFNRMAMYAYGSKKGHADKSKDRGSRSQKGGKRK